MGPPALDSTVRENGSGDALPNQSVDHLIDGDGRLLLTRGSRGRNQGAEEGKR